MSRDLRDNWRNALEFLKSQEDEGGKELYSQLLLHGTTYMYAWVRRSMEMRGCGNITGDLDEWAPQYYERLDNAIERANAYLMDNSLFNLDSQDILVLPKDREAVRDMARQLMDLAHDSDQWDLIKYIVEDALNLPKKT